MKISVVIITLNEEINIKNCLEAVVWADERIVIDGGSSDQTVAIAKASGAIVYEIPFSDVATQKNNGLARATHDWILMLDADERITPELEQEIKGVITHDRGGHVYAIKRDTYFMGKKLRFSGTQNDYQTRLIPKGRAFMKQSVHAVVRTELPLLRLEESMIHVGTRDMDHYRQKLNCSLAFGKEVLKEKKVKVTFLDIYFRPLLKWFTIYIIQGGILDGWGGLQYSFLSAYYIYLKYNNQPQIQKAGTP